MALSFITLSLPHYNRNVLERDGKGILKGMTFESNEHTHKTVNSGINPSSAGPRCTPTLQTDLALHCLSFSM